MDRCRRSPQPTRPDASRGCSRKCRSVRYTYSSLSSFVVARRVAAGPIKAVPRRRRDTRFLAILENNARRACPSGSLSATPRARVRQRRHGSHRAIHHILRQGHRQGPGDLHRCARRTRPRASPSFPASQISPPLGRTVELPPELTLPPLPAHSRRFPPARAVVPTDRRDLVHESERRGTRPIHPDTSPATRRPAPSCDPTPKITHFSERIFPTSTKPNRCLRS